MPETGAQLFQNTPNPFTQNTTIAMLIPDEVAKATLYVYDMQGTQKKSIPINSRGNTSVTISCRLKLLILLSEITSFCANNSSYISETILYL